jgi:hypothetical protein
MVRTGNPKKIPQTKKKIPQTISPKKMCEDLVPLNPFRIQ